MDVSETFGADQLWLSKNSGLSQRCSLPENLWTAVIQLWTALKTKFFRAKSQSWNNAVSARLLSETALSSVDFSQIQIEKFWFISLSFEILRSTSISQPDLRKELNNENLVDHFSYWPKIEQKTENLGLLLLSK